MRFCKPNVFPAFSPGPGVMLIPVPIPIITLFQSESNVTEYPTSQSSHSHRVDEFEFELKRIDPDSRSIASAVVSIRGPKLEKKNVNCGEFLSSGIDSTTIQSEAERTVAIATSQDLERLAFQSRLRVLDRMTQNGKRTTQANAFPQSSLQIGPCLVDRWIGNRSSGPFGSWRNGMYTTFVNIQEGPLVALNGSFHFEMDEGPEHCNSKPID